MIYSPQIRRPFCEFFLENHILTNNPISLFTYIWHVCYNTCLFEKCPDCGISAVKLFHQWCYHNFAGWGSGQCTVHFQCYNGSPFPSQTGKTLCNTHHAVCSYVNEMLKRKLCKWMQTDTHVWIQNLVGAHFMCRDANQSQFQEIPSF